MTRDEIIVANDKLRTRFSGGRVEVHHGPYDIDDRTMGRMLCAIARYDTFSPDSPHDEGVMLFAGFQLAWKIELADSERVMRVWINDDMLQSGAEPNRP